MPVAAGRSVARTAAARIRVFLRQGRGFRGDRSGRFHLPSPRSFRCRVPPCGRRYRSRVPGPKPRPDRPCPSRVPGCASCAIPGLTHCARRPAPLRAGVAIRACRWPTGPVVDRRWRPSLRDRPQSPGTAAWHPADSLPRIPFRHRRGCRGCSRPSLQRAQRPAERQARRRRCHARASTARRWLPPPAGNGSAATRKWHHLHRQAGGSRCRGHPICCLARSSDPRVRDSG